MNFEALQIFCDVVRFQSFSRGAIANSVSQSAASQAVRQLEKRLQVQLIEEAQLFLEASHACQARLASRPVAPLQSNATPQAE